VQRERILFVDDEEQIVRPLQKILNRMGYEVVISTSSAEAWRLFCENPNGFDLVLTDQTMPEMTGTELTNRIKELRPEIPIVLITGLDSPPTSDYGSEGVFGILLKPFTITELVELISNALERLTKYAAAVDTSFGGADLAAVCSSRA